MMPEPIDLRALASDPAAVLYEPPELRYVPVDDEPPWPSLTNGGDVSRASPGRQLRGMSWADLTAMPDEPPPMLAVGVPKVGLTVLAGAPKVGKSLYADQIALEQTPSTIVVEEGNLAGVSWRLRHQAAGLDIAEPDVVVIHRQAIRLDERASVQALRNHVERRRPKLLVIDPLNRAHGRNEDRANEMTPIMDTLSAIAADFECAVLVIHHVVHHSDTRFGHDRMRGSTAIRSASDANLVLSRAEGGHRLEGELRDGEDVRLSLALDPETLLLLPSDEIGSAKVPTADLLAFVAERGQVTARQVMERFGLKSKHTALGALRGMSALDSYDGSRGQQVFTLRVRDGG